jgi:hypothetical protein
LHPYLFLLGTPKQQFIASFSYTYTYSTHNHDELYVSEEPNSSEHIALVHSCLYGRPARENADDIIGPTAERSFCGTRNSLEKTE